MKVGKAALVCAGLIGSSAYAHAAAFSGLSANRRRFLREQEVAVNLTQETSPSAPTSTSISSSVSAPSSTVTLSVTEPTYVVVPSTTLRTSAATHDGLPTQDMSSLTFATSFTTLPSQQGSATSSWSSSSSVDSTTRSGRSQSTASTSPSISSPSSLSSTCSSTFSESSSTSDGSVSSPTPQGKSSSLSYSPSTHNNTTALGSSTLRNSIQPPYPTTATNGSMLTGPGTASRVCPTGGTKGTKCYVVKITTKTVAAVPTTTVTSKPCTPFDNARQPVTIYSIVHTSTVTFFGNRINYTPPYSTFETPHYCPPSETYDSPLPTDERAKSHSTENTINTQPLSHTTILLGLPSPTELRKTITFITTDKNPWVVFPSDPPPDSGHGPTDPYPDPVIHKTADPVETAHLETATDADLQLRPTFRITARADQVLINAEIFSPRPGATAVVTVDGGLFTIYPNAVVGEGVIVTKPPPAPTKVIVPAPTSGAVGGLGVFLSDSEVVIGGVAMTIPLYETTTLVRGQIVTVSPKTIAVGTSVFLFNLSQPPPESDVVVDGGEMLTAVGKSVLVLHEKTITYGAGIPAQTEIFDDDTITVGPSGALVHGVLMGGPTAGTNDTRYEIIGGASVTRIAPSIAIINGKVFTIGSDIQLTTTEIARHVFTIGPQGLAFSALNMTYPFGSSVVSTVVPTGTWLSNFPLETNPKKDKDSSSPSVRRNKSHSGIAVCIAVGVLIFA